MSGFMMTYKGVPSTYNKDLQEDKEPLFDTVDNVWASLRIAEGVVATLEVMTSTCPHRISPSLTAHRFTRTKCWGR
jgi:argininosuccinate lyase